MKIPLRYVCEMVCDRVAASQIYLGGKYTDRLPLGVLRAQQRPLSAPPRDESAAGKAAPDGAGHRQERTFAYMKFLLGCEKDY